jgi:hypothetical protein
MKKIYTLLTSLILVAGVSKAQLSLTKSAFEPVSGDVEHRKGFDSASTGSIPRQTGANQSWDFSTLVTTTSSPVANTYTSPASAIPGGTNYPTATIGMTDGTQSSFFKSTTSSYEMVGMNTGTATLNFTNTAVIANWPINFGYTNTDPVGGTINATGFGNGTFSGNITTNASGSGTVTMPNALTFTNCLQVTATLNINAVITVSSLPFPVDLQLITYQYYHSSQKFPIVTVTTTGFDSPIGSNTTTAVSVNNLIFAGINEMTFDNSYSVYPNPASGSFHVLLNNPSSENVSVAIINQLGQMIRKEELGNNAIDASIDIKDMPSGVYFVKTSLGNKNSVKKLIIQ